MVSKDITLHGGTNKQLETNTYSSKMASIGATFTGGVATRENASFAKENSDGTKVIVGYTLAMHSSKDTNFIGSQIGSKA